jgi:hypothetical protein
MRTFHSKSLAALAIFLAPFAFAARVASVLLLLLSGPMRWLFHRLGRLRSPGRASLSALRGRRGAERCASSPSTGPAFRNLEFGAVALLGALLVANGLALLLLGRRVRAPRRAAAPPRAARALHRGRGRDRTSAFTLGARQTVAATLFNRSLLAQRVARSLQVASTSTATASPPSSTAATATTATRHLAPRPRHPGQRRDENCSGRDARVEPEESDGTSSPLPERLRSSRPSFVLLSIDAMRPDHMGAYGYRRPTTPNIDRFARGARASPTRYCASPRSLRSFASILVGRYASMRRVGQRRAVSAAGAPPTSPSPSSSTSAGYLTAACTTRATSPHRGLLPGLRRRCTRSTVSRPTWPPPSPRIRSSCASTRTTRSPSSCGRTSWSPTTPTATARARGTSATRRWTATTRRSPRRRALAPVLKRSSTSWPPSDAPPRGRFVFADHGEAFGEHGVYHHSFDLHDEALRVPISCAAGRHAGSARTRSRRSSTCTPRCSTSRPRARRSPVSGAASCRSLDPSPGAAHAAAGGAHLYAEVTPDGVFPSEQKSLYAPPYKLIHDVRRGTWELFDIARDPGEIRNLYDDRPELAADAARAPAHLDRARRPGQPLRASSSPRRACRASPRCSTRCTCASATSSSCSATTSPRPVRINDTYRAVFYYRVLRARGCPCPSTSTSTRLDGQPIWPLFARGTCPSTALPHHRVEPRRDPPRRGHAARRPRDAPPCACGRTSRWRSRRG